MLFTPKKAPGWREQPASPKLVRPPACRAGEMKTLLVGAVREVDELLLRIISRGDVHTDSDPTCSPAVNFTTRPSF